MSALARRDALERPYSGAHSASVARQAERGRTPRTLGEYLRWFADGWHAEMPTEMHGLGVFVGGPDPHLAAKRSTSKELIGGSLLGSPKVREPFRRLLENSPFETEFASYDGNVQPDPHYVRPMHAAIARLSQRMPLGARWLSALAFCDFDWPSLVTRRGWSLEEGELYLVALCYQLWREFDLQPRERAGVA